MKKILITGALGQIGAELVTALRERFGRERIVSSDVRKISPAGRESLQPFETVDCTQGEQVLDAIRKHDVGTVYHLAALLSAVAEEKPQAAWAVNLGGLYQVLEAARVTRCAVFHPSSIGAFGPDTPRNHTPQDTIQRPTTMYGVTKVTGELLCDYYQRRFDVDTRGLRFPGLISHVAPPGGGTTDYAVEMFHGAVRDGRYTCFLRDDTRLDMMYMPDAIQACMQLMEVDPDKLEHRNAFNLAAMNFTPRRLAAAIREHIPGFAVDYKVDPVRQAIADSWPASLDDSAAREEWGWRPRFDLDGMTADMLRAIRERVTDGAGGRTASGRPLIPAGS